MDAPVALDDPVAVFRERVIRATQGLLGDKGLGVSMDDIAAAARVGRTSLFRHFASRDDLVAQALDRSLAWFGDQLSQQLATELSLEDWLATVARQVHHIHLDAGRGLWQLAAANDDELPPEIAEVNRRRRNNRRRWTATGANRAWQLAGGSQEAPDTVVDAFALTLSSFSTRSMINDLRLSVDRTAANAAAVLATVIRDQLEQ